MVHLDNLKAPPKPRKSNELFGNDGNLSPAKPTEQKAEASQRTEKNIKEQEQPRTYIDDSQAIPQSMRGFDQNESAPASVDIQEKISPHKRIPPSAPSIPLSMQDLDGKQPEPKQEKTVRRKEKVHIRRTSQGWVEFDKEKEDNIKKRKAEEDEAAGIQPEDASQLEDPKPEDSKDVPESKELEGQAIRESTHASWQAFASSAPSSSFQVGSQLTQRYLY